MHRMRYATQADLQARRLETLYASDPYTEVRFEATGPIEMLAIFVDEHIEAANCALSQTPYKQGEALEGIRKAIEKNGHWDASPTTCVIFDRV